MNISGASDFSSSLAAQALNMKSSSIQRSIQTAVLKQILDQQKSANDALVRMIQEPDLLKLTGGLIDLRA